MPGVLAYEWPASPHSLGTSSEEMSKLDVADQPIGVGRPGNYIESSMPHHLRAKILVVHYRRQQHARMIWPASEPIHVKSPVVFGCAPVVDSNRSPELVEYLQSSFHCSDHPRFPPAIGSHPVNREEKIVIPGDHEHPYEVLIFCVLVNFTRLMARRRSPPSIQKA